MGIVSESYVRLLNNYAVIILCCAMMLMKLLHELCYILMDNVQLINLIWIDLCLNCTYILYIYYGHLSLAEWAQRAKPISIDVN